MTKQFRPEHLIAAAVIWRGNEILLVEQRGPGDTVSAWALPGGRAEPNELLVETLVREVGEETGLKITDPGRLLFLSQIDNPNQQQIMENAGPGVGYLATAVTFEVTGWEGSLEAADPDGYIEDVRFVPVPEAILLIEQTLHFRAMREPLLAYLRGQAPPGTSWFYRRRSDGQDELLYVSEPHLLTESKPIAN
jgi:ADP-ribose pyrophosphatase YjhB (NUDIX family)